MIDVLTRNNKNMKFIDINFEGYPFQTITDKGEKLSNVFDDFIEKQREKELESNNKICQNNEPIEFIYENINFKLYQKPIIFKLFYENNLSFKVYEPKLLSQVLIELDRYYIFQIEDEFKDINSIIKLEKENNIKDNIIILIPYIFFIFRKLYFSIDYAKLIKIENNSYFEIDKEQLDPFFLYIENKKIQKAVKDINIDNSKIKSKLEKNLYFIMNEERKKFIDELNKYVQIDFQKEPMIIIGNDGIGKTLTLQLYTLIKLDEYRKIYFNLKIFENQMADNYLLIELMKGFASENDNDFKEYINCVSKFQNKKINNKKEFFEVLTEVLFYLKVKLKYKFIIILDQFNFDNLESDEFNKFKYNFSGLERFKIIICYSLNDNQNKKIIFSDYKDISFYESFSCKPTLRKRDIDKVRYAEEFQKYKNDIGTKLDDFYIIKKWKKENDAIKIKESMDKSKNDEKINQKLNQNLNQKKEFNKKPNINLLEDNYKGKLKVFPKLNIQYYNVSEEKLKLYFSNLISIEKIISDKYEPEDPIFKCLSDFNFLPKYYYKFYIFKIIQELKGEENINNIIKSFYEEENKIIKLNIKKFYYKMDLIRPYPNENLYKNLLKLKTSMLKIYEKSIDFGRLYIYFKKFPFKYMNILLEKNKNTDFFFNEDITNSTFKLALSFLFVEEVIDSIIDEFNNEDKININHLSGGAYGNCLEIKIRQNLKILNQDIEVLKVWSLNKMSINVKNEKMKEIKKNTYKANRYKNLEDINNLESIKLSNKKYFYFFPENQINKLLDSLILIKNNNNEFDMIAFQIIKNKPSNKIKDKSDYSNFIIYNIKEKFEELYYITISNIYFWYILNNDSDNELNCKNLHKKGIKYLFYSIKNKCFYEQRDQNEINNLSYFQTKDSLIYPFSLIVKTNKYNAPETYTKHIKAFESEICYLFWKYKNITFEFIRYDFFKNNFGPKIEDKLEKNIIKTLKNNISYSNDFKLLFLFGFRVKFFNEFRKLEEQDELVYLLKIKDINYMFFKNKCFKINDRTSSLNNCEFPEIPIESNNLTIIEYNTNEIEFSSIENIRSLESIVYLFKIYYLGECLKEK